MTIHLRASGAGRYTSCPGSIEPPKLKLVSDDEYARMGTAAHAASMMIVRDGTPFVEAVASSADAESVDREQVSMLTGMAMSLWRGGLQDHFPGMKYFEEAFESPGHTVQLSGHIDILTVVGESVRILDWKFGYLSHGAEPQMRAYAKLVFDAMATVEKVSACVVQVRARTADWFHWDREEIRIWWESVLERLKTGGYNPSAASCRFCPRRAECPERTAMVQQAHTMLSDHGEWAGTLPPMALAMLHDRIKLVRGACDEADAILRAEIAANGGAIAIGDGRQLTLTKREIRPIIDAARAAKTLVEGGLLPQEAVDRTLKMGKGKVETEIKALAPSKQKGTKAKEAIEALDAAGCIGSEWQERLEISPIPITNEASNESGNGYTAAEITGAIATIADAIRPPRDATA